MATKKSAASAKPAKTGKMTQEDFFKKAKGALVYKIKSQVIASKRIDAMVAIREEYKSFYGKDPELNTLKALQKRMTEVYEEIDEIISNLTVEKVKEDGDPIADKFSADPMAIKDKDEMFEAFMIYMYARPWGENLFNLKVELENLEV